MLTIVLLTLGAVALLTAEAVTVGFLRVRIPLRIHVNGTRGKSSVAAYVAAALRAHGRRTMCKVTGIRPTLILPDGTRQSLRRWGRARVQEQISLLRRAVHLRCDALVVECMSIAPLLQRVETSALRPTLTILTNVLDDHREELGITEGERVAGFCSALPRKSVLLSNERLQAGPVEQAAMRVGTHVIYPGEEDLSGISGHMLPENISLALAACRWLGLDPLIAREAIFREAQVLHGGSLRILWEREDLRFINGFAVNDVPSAERFIAHWKSQLGSWAHCAFILNARSDRPLRSVEFARWGAGCPDAPEFILIGSHKHWMRRSLVRQGVSPVRITVWSSKQARASGEGLKKWGFPRGTTILGLGNVAGDGFLVLEGLQTWS